MTKKQLIKWLENKQHEAIETAKEKFSEMMDEYITKRNEIMKLDETASQIAELISKADDIVDAWKKDIEKKCGVDTTVNYYSSLKSRLSYILTTEEVKKYMLYEFVDSSTSIRTIKKKNDEVIDGINKNYINVIANVQNLKDAKTGMEYIKELGFDLSDLLKADEQPITTALSTPIDTRYLFIKGGE
ncbi:MAG: hypothetical protein J6Q48_06045 [Bacteroidaceae bacterium]|nr:hypothetical protein [Bacteroidaceae bacterium]